jgi:Class III cytochrome C family
LARNWPTGLFFAAFALLCFVACGKSELYAQISPGPLSKAHQSLSGVTQCTSCHKLGTGGVLKCLECHTEINKRLTEKKGFHSAVVKMENPNRDCVRCHSEHNGENFQLIRWEPSQEKFDHGKTGYALEGKHAAITCKQCHTATNIQAEFRTLIKQKDPNKSFLGLTSTCLSCHKDFHQGQLSKNCQNCHNSTNWKDVSRFHHANTRYPLTGKHAEVACAKCHAPMGPGLPPKYTGLNFGSCANCHSDPHHGAFKKDCSSCHVTGGWKQLSTAGLSSQFDHSKTNFPLLGKHQGVDCAKCHRSGDFKTKIPFALCSDCHRPDPHGGQFLKRKDGGKCEACHTVEGWKPAKFTVQDHATSAYPLEAKHAKVECAKCHIPAGAATRYKIKFAQCTDCHKDAHGGQFAAAPLLNRCEGCHTVKGFSPSTFTLARHKQTKFALTGAHAAVACADCHTSKRKDGSLPAPYHFADLACTACHEDVHRGQFREQMSKKRAGCETCHSVDEWKDLTKFDHDRTAFPLAGAHKAAACIACHKPPNLETGLRNVSFKAAPKVCESCHEDPHGKQFARNGAAPGCEQCHRVVKWKPSTFDHEKTAFSLKGAHMQVRCTACHKQIVTVEDKQVLYYRPTPKECAACHGAKVTGL